MMQYISEKIVYFQILFLVTTDYLCSFLNPGIKLKILSFCLFASGYAKKNLFLKILLNY